VVGLPQHPAAALLQVRETDLDALEAVVGVVAFGDVDAEAPGAVAEHSLRRLLRLAQLAAEYLLHVQDRLAAERCLLRVHFHVNPVVSLWMYMHSSNGGTSARAHQHGKHVRSELSESFLLLALRCMLLSHNASSAAGISACSETAAAC